eukprot:SAG31_NODE_10300_length_1158_cov_1.167139_2_plen_159_part_00
MAADVVCAVLAENSLICPLSEHTEDEMVVERHGFSAAAAAGRAWLSQFVPGGEQAVWWDVAQQPPAMEAAGVSAETFRDSCRAHVTESALLLKAALRHGAGGAWPAGADGSSSRWDPKRTALVAEDLLLVDGFYGAVSTGQQHRRFLYCCCLGNGEDI